MQIVLNFLWIVIYLQDLLKVMYMDPSLNSLCDIDYNPCKFYHVAHSLHYFIFTLLIISCHWVQEWDIALLLSICPYYISVLFLGNYWLDFHEISWVFTTRRRWLYPWPVLVGPFNTELQPLIGYTVYRVTFIPVLYY